MMMMTIIIIITLFTVSVNGFSTRVLIGDTNGINSNQIKERCFLEREKLDYPEKNSRSRVESNKLNPHMTPSLGIELWPHWWEASALPAAPTLLPVATCLTAPFSGFLALVNLRDAKVTGGRPIDY